MRPMNVRYTKWLAIAELAVGVLLFLVSLLDPQWIGLFAGAILALLGFLQLKNPALKVSASEVQLCSPLGKTVKRFPVSSPADLRFEGNTLRHAVENKKIVALGWGYDKGDVEQLRSQLQHQQ